jgi:hypothetical protein
MLSPVAWFEHSDVVAIAAEHRPGLLDIKELVHPATASVDPRVRWSHCFDIAHRLEFALFCMHLGGSAFGDS